MITEEQAQEWIYRIRRADWYYNYSDDYGAWSRGNAECSAIRRDGKEADLTAEELQMVIDIFMKNATNEKQETIDYIIERINSVLGK